VYKLKFLVFALYNFNYKDGTNKHAQPQSVVLALAVFEGFFLIFLFALLDNLFNLSIMYYFKVVPIPVSAILIYALTYWYFLSQRGFEKLYEQYHNADINTKTNNIIAGVTWVVYFIGIVALISSIKYLFS
jgi:hypothetical protein